MTKAPAITIEGGEWDYEGPFAGTAIRLADVSNVVVQNNVIRGNTWPKTTLQWLLQHPAIRTRSRVVRFRVRRGVWW